MQASREDGGKGLLEAEDELRKEYGFSAQEITEMPIWKFHLRATRLMERRENEAKSKQQELIFTEYVAARSLMTSLYTNSDMPLTPQQQRQKPKPSDVAKIREAQEQHKQQALEWSEALKSLQHFGAHLGMPGVFGEPAERKLDSAEAKELARQEARDRRERLIEKFRGFAEEHGNVVMFEDRETRAKKKQKRQAATPGHIKPPVETNPLPVEGAEEMGLQERLMGAHGDYVMHGKGQGALDYACQRWIIEPEALRAYLDSLEPA